MMEGRKTLATFGAALTTALVLLLIHYTSVEGTLSEGGLYAALSTAVGSLVAVVLRFMTRTPVGGRQDDSANAKPSAVEFPAKHLLVLLLGVMLAGCGSTFLCSKTYERTLKPTAPFADQASCDGEEVFRASGPISASFRVRCPEGQAPAFDREGVVTCRRGEAGP